MKMKCYLCGKEIKKDDKYTASLDRVNGVTYVHIQCLKNQANKVAGKNDKD